MPRTPQNLVRHELIGLDVEVLRSTDPHKTGTEGKVVDETMNSIKILTRSGVEKTIPKKEAVFRFKLSNQNIEINGTSLIGRPEERIKR